MQALHAIHYQLDPFSSRLWCVHMQALLTQYYSLSVELSVARVNNVVTKILFPAPSLFW